MTESRLSSQSAAHAQRADADAPDAATRRPAAERGVALLLTLGVLSLLLVLGMSFSYQATLNSMIAGVNADMTRSRLLAESALKRAVAYLNVTFAGTGKDGRITKEDVLKAVADMGGLVPLEGILSRPVKELKGDDRNIAVLARAYHGVSIDAARNEKGAFVEPIK